MGHLFIDKENLRFIINFQVDNVFSNMSTRCVLNKVCDVNVSVFID